MLGVDNGSKDPIIASMSDTITYDALIVGAGPSGLAAAIQLKKNNPEVSVCVIEKAAEVGGHILSGAAFEPDALTELIPELA